MMKDFTDARNVALEELSKTETLSILTASELRGKKLDKFAEVWMIKKCVCQKGIGKELTFYLCLKFDFPLSVPSIYLAKESYEEVGYVPHIDSDFLICLYDEELTVTNPQDPAGIIDASLKKARLIIEAGLEKSNFLDFETEFLSYWENKYAPKDVVNLLLLSFIEENPTYKPVKLLSLEKPLRKYEYILWQENEEAVRFVSFLKEKKIKFTESAVFYIDVNLINDIPPFNITCKTSFEIISRLGKDVYAQLKRFLNQGLQKKLVLVRKKMNGKEHFIGWFYPWPDITRKGFRCGILKPFDAYSSFQSSELVQRISPKDYTSDRLLKRSKGNDSSNCFKILVAGLGSIGSNLIYFLNSLDYPEFRLVDYDWLTIENTERHLLGFDKVNASKTDAMREYIKAINPKQEVKTKEDSIINVCNEDINFINNSDFLFIVIGKSNIEKFIVEKLRTGVITKPVFIIWVEPYIAGGHCIYIHPDNLKHDEFYESVNGWNLFKYNVISNEEYIGGNRLLSMKEASCQTTYIPYSGSSIVLFLSQIYPKILKIISIKSKESICLTWLGDLNDVKTKGIKLSEFAEKNDSFQIIENRA